MLNVFELQRVLVEAGTLTNMTPCVLDWAHTGTLPILHALHVN